jgi:aspartate carbamoyltransferase catalytic subunit
MENVTSMRYITKDDILLLIERAEKIEMGDGNKPDLSKFVSALMFFEPSTRTLFSFDTAMKQLNGKTIIMTGTQTTSVKKGETFADTIRMVSAYSDLIITRTEWEGAAQYASEISDKPVINAGDGSNQHPTQALLDLYSIYKTQGRLNNISIAMVGDLKMGRTVHSLVYGLMHFSPKLYLVSPTHLQMPKHIKSDLKKSGMDYEEYQEPDQIMDKIDVMYVTRIQKERFIDPEEYEKVKDSYQISSNMLNNVKSNMKIMHPLPRVNEITTDVDKTPYAYYFQQAKNGIYMRQALISTLLGQMN